MYSKNGLNQSFQKAEKQEEDQEQLIFYYKVNVGLSSLEELRKRLITSDKYKNTVLLKKVDLEIFLQNILLALEDVNLLADGYGKMKERADLLNSMFLKASEHESFFLNKLIGTQRKELENVA